MEVDNYFLEKRFFNRHMPGLLKTDRAILYLKQQIGSICKEIEERTTKTIGETYYRIHRLRSEFLPIFKLSGEILIVDKLAEIANNIGYRTTKSDALHNLLLLIQFLDNYKAVEEEEILLLKEKIEKLEQQLYDNSENTTNEEIDIEDSSTVFVIMPFNKDFNDVWKGGIEKAAKNEGYKPIRVDMLHKSSNITDDIIESIKKCKISIVDVSTNNPNVMFELGFTIALNKPNIIISQSVEYLPFDIRNIRTILYDNTWSGIEELRVKIQEFLKEFKPIETTSTSRKRSSRKK